MVSVITSLSFMILIIWALFFLFSLVKVLSILLIFSKNQLFTSIDLFYCYFLLYFFCGLNYFFPSVYFGIFLFLLYQFLQGQLRCLFGIFLVCEVGLYSCELPFQNCFCCIPLILKCFVSLSFFCFKIVSDFLFDSLIVQQHVVQSSYILVLVARCLVFMYFSFSGTLFSLHTFFPAFVLVVDF